MLSLSFVVVANAMFATATGNSYSHGHPAILCENSFSIQGRNGCNTDEECLKNARLKCEKYSTCTGIAWNWVLPGRNEEQALKICFSRDNKTEAGWRTMWRKDDDILSICETRWAEQIRKCQDGNLGKDGHLRNQVEDDFLQIACCKNEGVPYECGGDCWGWDGVGPCEEWEQEVEECLDVNEAKMCCKEKGVPEECSAYCDTAYLLSNILKNESK